MRSSVRVGDERAQQLVVARAGLVRAADERVDDREPRLSAEAIGRQSGAGSDAAGPRGGVLERAHDRRSERDDAIAAAPGRPDRGDRRRGQEIGLGQRQSRVEGGVAGRRQAGGVGQRREADAALLESIEQPPVEHESGRRRLERDRLRRDAGPHVPERERLGDVRVLHRAAVAGDAGTDVIGVARERELDQSRMVEQANDRRSQRAEQRAHRRRAAAAAARGPRCGCGNRRRRRRRR